MDTTEEEWVRMHIHKTLHNVHILRRRELGNIKRGTHVLRAQRDFFRCVPLDHSVTITDRTPTIPITFSPDGKYLVAFNRSMRTVNIHKYMGVERGIGMDPEDAFKRILPLIGEMTLYGQWMANAVLVKDFALFTEDGRHMIVCASAGVNENAHNLSQVYRNNESLPLGTHSLERYALISIDVHRVAMCDVFCMPTDRVALHHGVSIRGGTVCILSLQHQNIYVLNIDAKGKFVVLKTVGPSVLEDDELFLKIENGNFGRSTAVLSGFKQKLFTFLYKKCKREGGMAVHMFHRAMGTLRKLKMSRVHMLDERHLFIRMSDEIRMPHPFSNVQPFFTVIFNWRDSEIVHVFHVTDYVDSEYFSFFEEFAENLTTNGLTTNHFPCSASHCAPVRNAFRRTWTEIVKSPPEIIQANSQWEMTRRLVYTLPWGCQLQSQYSAYLDPTLFFIDDRFLHSILRGRLMRNLTNGFKVCSGSRTLFMFNLPTSDSSQLQSIIFHPKDPLAISADRSASNISLTLYLPSGAQLDG